jgi:plastocyanin
LKTGQYLRGQNRREVRASSEESLIIKHFAIFLLFCLGAAGYGASLADTQPDEVVHAAVSEDGIQHVSIEGGSYYFKPSHVIVKVNVPVELTVSIAKGVIPHTLVIQSPEANISVDERLSSEPKTIRFTPTAKGSFPFYCKNRLLFLKSHREKGMEGVLEVVE